MLAGKAASWLIICICIYWAGGQRGWTNKLYFVIFKRLATIYMLSVRKKEGETGGSLLYRFTKKIRQGGVLSEAKKRRFYKRSQNRSKRKLAAIYREEKKKEVAKAKKMGLL